VKRRQTYIFSSVKGNAGCAQAHQDQNGETELEILDVILPKLTEGAAN
jgi:hypothetical protein